MRSRFPANALVLPLAMILAVTGCKSSGYKKADTAGRGLQTGAQEVKNESEALQSTMQALDTLVNKPATDLEPQYIYFSHSLDWLKTCAKKTNASGERIKKRNAAYMAAWNKQLNQMSYDYIRTTSETRKNEVAGQLQAVDQRYTEAQAAVQPLIDYLEDIRRALSIDLTVGGLESTKPIVTKARENSNKLETALARLTDELTNSGTQISSFVPESRKNDTSLAAVPTPTGSTNTVTLPPAAETPVPENRAEAK